VKGEQPLNTRLKHDLLFSSYDKERLMPLLRIAGPTKEDRDQLDDLLWEIRFAAEIEPEEVPPDLVTMNATVRVTDLDTSVAHTYTIVFPRDANDEEGKISVLVPLGTALLGYRRGDVVHWHVPRGVRQVRIDEIIYQPEAAGDYQL
jgi:regulator of nucleoside diphosphate kinase